MDFEAIKAWVLANQLHAIVIVVCAVLGLFVSPVLAGLIGVLYIAHVNGYLAPVIDWVKSRVG